MVCQMAHRLLARRSGQPLAQTSGDNMRIGDLVQSRRYKILGVVVDMCYVTATILWLDKNTKTIENKSDVQPLEVKYENVSK